MNDFESPVCGNCGADLDEITGLCHCAVNPLPPRNKFQPPIPNGMRAMAARKYEGRSEVEMALGPLSSCQRVAVVDLAEGRPIGRRIASGLSRRGLVLVDGAAPPRLSALGAAVANLETSRQRKRKEPPRASQEGE